MLNAKNTVYLFIFIFFKNAIPQEHTQLFLCLTELGNASGG